jgi:SAM-dependent methyltransferase
MKSLRHAWGDPLARGVDINAPGTISVHRRIISSKPLLRAAYRHWYQDFVAAVRAAGDGSGPVIELGCGASHLDEYLPGVIKTDVVAHSNVDIALSAEALPFADGSVRAIVALGVLHHLDEPLKCLTEAQRCLVRNGRLVLIEPSGSPLHRFMVRKFHPHEYYDKNVREWRNTTSGRLSAANNALPWIIFVRDREAFERQLPGLRIRSIRPHTFVMYYLSGGLSYRPFVPGALLPLVEVVEVLARPFRPSLGTMMTVEIEKV